MSTQLAVAAQAILDHPLFGFGITLGAYQLALALFERTRWVFLQPVLLSMTLVVGVLLLCGIDYAEYRQSVSMLSVFLGPATVALAVPLYAQIQRVRAMFWPIVIALVVGCLTAALSAMAVGKLFGASAATVLSLAPKSVTTPIAMGIAEQVGGLPSLTAVLVILTGILGAVGARYLFNALKVHDPAVRGFAIGIASHGIGTARAFQVSEQSGAFAALAMGLNGALTALLLPLVLPWVKGWL